MTTLPDETRIQLLSPDPSGAALSIGCTWGEFKANNADGVDADEFASIALTLSAGRDYLFGRPAAPAFTIRLAARQGGARG